MYTCDFKSAVSEHAKDAGHSIDLRGVKIIDQENHLLSRKITLVNKHSYSVTGNELWSILKTVQKKGVKKGWDQL